MMSRHLFHQNNDNRSTMLTCNVWMAWIHRCASSSASDCVSNESVECDRDDDLSRPLVAWGAISRLWTWLTSSRSIRLDRFVTFCWSACTLWQASITLQKSVSVINQPAAPFTTDLKVKQSTHSDTHHWTADRWRLVPTISASITTFSYTVVNYTAV